MKHLFSSGEVMYKNNEKELEEGTLIGEYLEYDTVTTETRFVCGGILCGAMVEVSFFIAPEDFEWIKSRHTYGILMQSDVLSAQWKEYTVKKPPL